MCYKTLSKCSLVHHRSNVVSLYYMIICEIWYMLYFRFIPAPALPQKFSCHPPHMILLCPRHQSLIIIASCGERGWEMSYKLDPKTLSMRGLMWWWRVEHWITIMIGKGFDPFQCNKEHKFKCHKKCSGLEDEHVQSWRSTTNSDVKSPLLHYAFMQDNL